MDLKAMDFMFFWFLYVLKKIIVLYQTLEVLDAILEEIVWQKCPLGFRGDLLHPLLARTGR
jgi:hypothetical protein